MTDRQFLKDLKKGDMFVGTSDIRNRVGYIVVIGIRGGVAQCFSLDRQQMFLTSIGQLQMFYKKVA